MRGDPDDEVKSAAVALARVMRSGPLDWLNESLVEVSSWNKAITKQLEAEERSLQKK